MKNSVRRFIFIGIFLTAGCAKHVTVRPPTAPLPPVVVTTPEGVWQSVGRKGNVLKMIFRSNGTVEFLGGLGFYNPGHWVYDPGLREMKLTLPYAADDKLQVFKLYVGDGVKAFDRQRKQVTYDFTPQTDSLNIGGWLYTKVDKGSVDVPQEPTLK